MLSSTLLPESELALKSINSETVWPLERRYIDVTATEE